MKKKLCIALILLNLALIWGNSLLPGEQSEEVSGWFIQFLSFFPNPELAHTLIRKAAHFTEFAALGLLTGWHRRLDGKTIAIACIGFGLAAACIDETIQLFVSGRASSLLDVWLDTAGFSTGLGLMAVGYNKKHLEETEYEEDRTDPGPGHDPEPVCRLRPWFR